MNKKRVILLSITLIIVVGIIFFSVKYFSYKSYRDTLVNSNFLKWCQEVSVENVEQAELFSGYGQEKVAYQLTFEDKAKLINVLKEISPNDLSLRKEFTNSNAEGVNLYLRCQNG